MVLTHFIGVVSTEAWRIIVAWVLVTERRDGAITSAIFVLTIGAAKQTPIPHHPAPEQQKPVGNEPRPGPHLPPHMPYLSWHPEVELQKVPPVPQCPSLAQQDPVGHEPKRGPHLLVQVPKRS